MISRLVRPSAVRQGRRRIVNIPAGQGVRHDHRRSVDAQMQPFPPTRPAAPMCHGCPFTFTDNREPGTVDGQMDAGASGDTPQREVEPLRPPRKCCVIGCGEGGAQHPEEGRSQPAVWRGAGERADEASVRVRWRRLSTATARPACRHQRPPTWRSRPAATRR